MKIIAAFAIFSLSAWAAEPVVSKVIGKASAPVNSALPAGTEFKTGARSKSELALDKAIVRVGENAAVQTSVKGIALRQGATLVASQPGTFRKSVEVRAPGYRLKVKGTVQVSYEPGRAMKVVVLEGTATVALDSLAGEFETLKPGQLLVINPSDNRLPEPVEIDLNRLVATSQLVNGGFGELPTSSLIGASTGGQLADFTKGNAAQTPFILRGTELEAKDRQLRIAAALKPERPPDPETVEQTIFRAVNDIEDPKAIIIGKPKFAFDGVSQPSFGNSVIPKLAGARSERLTVKLANDYTELPDGSFVVSVAPRLFGNIGVNVGNFAGTQKILEFEATVDENDVGIVGGTIGNPPQTFTANPELATFTIAAGTTIQTTNGVGLRLTAERGLKIDSTLITTGSASSQYEVIDLRTTDKSIEVTGSTFSAGKVTVAGSSNATEPQAITLDSTRVGAKRGTSIGLPSVRTAITIRNSSDISAMLGSIDFFSKGAPVSVSDSRISAKNRITIDAFDPAEANASGVVTLRNAELAANAIRIRASSPSGDALIIDGSTMNAAQYLRLFAEGGGALRFRNSVTLNTSLAVIAGKTVTVDPGGNVSIAGKGRVFTDAANFNTGAFGTISGSGGVETKPFGARDPFDQVPKK